MNKPVAQTDIVWPTKTRELQNHHIDSTRWNGFKFRDDDIVIATYAKSGTTWMQQIISQLIFRGESVGDFYKISPWIDFRLTPPMALETLESLPHRRFMKTHLLVDALVFSHEAKYIYLGRDGRDTTWSLYNHYANFLEARRCALNEVPGLVGPPLPPCTVDVHAFYRNWFAHNGAPYWPFWENIRSWWAIRDLPNVKLVHFNQLKADLAGSIRDIAKFLEIPLDDKTLAKIVTHCSFDYMKSHAEIMAPNGGSSWNGGAQTFINKGTNGRWRDTLSAAEVAAYEQKAEAELGFECAAWLERGAKE
jgi:aryl sulfotransferase